MPSTLRRNLKALVKETLVNVRVSFQPVICRSYDFEASITP